MQVPVVYLTVLVLSSAGLVFELLAGAAAAYMFGDSVSQLAFVTGVFLSALGAGAWVTRYVDLRPADRFLDCQLAAALTGGLTAPLLFFAFARTALVHPILYGLVGLTGLFVGACVPLVLRVLKRRVTFRDLTARVLAVDYAGALLGSLAFALFALPHLGMVRSGLAFGLLSAATAAWGTIALGSDVSAPETLRRKALAVAAVLGVGLVLSDKLTALADDAVFSEPVIFAEQSAYQRIVLTRGHGGVNLFLDNNLQFSSVDEYRYHEALVHPAFAVAKRHARVLVLGGGDGLAAREILRYPDVNAVTLVDLDPAMTEPSLGSSPWLRELTHASMADPRMHVVNDDALAWLEERSGGGAPRSNEKTRGEPFDVAVVDFPDPNNFALGKLYTVRFYELLKAALSPDGVAVVQSTSPLMARRSFWCIEATLKSAGFLTRPYHALVPAFGEWGFVLAGQKPFAPFARLPAGLRYLDEKTLLGLFDMAPDLAKVDVEVNRLSNQVLVHTYEEEWQRYVR